VDRLGIVDTDEVREILTPLVNRGLIRRVLSHAKAHNETRRLRIPKREVKVWEVVMPIPSPSVLPERGVPHKQPQQVLHPGGHTATEPASTSPTAASVVDDVQSAASHQIYLGNLHYSAEREDLTDLLSNHCEVISLQVPAGLGYGNKNRGFAFATVGYEGTMEVVISKLDGLELRGRRLLVRRQLPKIPR